MDTAKITEIVIEVLQEIEAKKNRPDRKKALIILEKDLPDTLLSDAVFKTAGDYQKNILFLGDSAEKTGLPKAGPVIVPADLPKDIEKWVEQFELILLPDPSLKSISKLAHIIIDNVMLEVIFAALVIKSKVMINSGFFRFSNLPPALQQEAEKLITKIRGFGLEVRDFGLAAPHKEPVLPTVKDVKSKRKQVLTVEDIKERLQGETFKIEAGAILTPLAQDYIKEHHIQIIN